MAQEKTIEIFLLMTAPLIGIAVVAGLLAIDLRITKRKLLETECAFEAIDPIRAEAGVEMSDKCKCFWKEQTLEQLRKMKP